MYTSEFSPTQGGMDSFFAALPLPTLPTDEANTLEAPISIEEIEWAIQSLSAGKSPGPDGIMADIFKIFFPLLVTPLT